MAERSWLSLCIRDGLPPRLAYAAHLLNFCGVYKLVLHWLIPLRVQSPFPRGVWVLFYLKGVSEGLFSNTKYSWVVFGNIDSECAFDTFKNIHLAFNVRKLQTGFLKLFCGLSKKPRCWQFFILLMYTYLFLLWNLQNCLYKCSQLSAETGPMINLI